MIYDRGVCSHLRNENKDRTKHLFLVKLIVLFRKRKVLLLILLFFVCLIVFCLLFCLFVLPNVSYMPNLRSVNSQKKDIIWTYLDKLYFITWAKATDRTVYTGYQTNSIFITSEDLEDGFQRDSMRNEETDSLNCSVSAIISIHFPVLFFSLTSYECWSSLGHSLWSFYLPDLVVSFHQNVKRILKCIYPDQTSLLNSRFLC